MLTPGLQPPDDAGDARPRFAVARICRFAYRFFSRRGGYCWWRNGCYMQDGSATGIGLIGVIADAEGVLGISTGSWAAMVRAGMMRQVTRPAAIALALLIGCVPLLNPVEAAAQPINGSARWCAVQSQHGGMLDCAYHSLEQCMAAAAGVSHRCLTNPWFVERRVVAPRKREVPR